MSIKSISIPAGMIHKKFYCYQCGSKLTLKSKTRIIRKGDPEFKEHSKIGNTYFFSNQVELTEYDFECKDCNTYITYYNLRRSMRYCTNSKIYKKQYFVR